MKQRIEKIEKKKSFPAFYQNKDFKKSLEAAVFFFFLSYIRLSSIHKEMLATNLEFWLFSFPNLACPGKFFNSFSYFFLQLATLPVRR